VPLSESPNPTPAASARDHHIATIDGFVLGARLWTLAGAAAPTTVAVINAGAGISSVYYDRFAAFLAEAGCPTIVYDYRGIGLSRPPSLRGFEASVEQWGSKDCAALLTWLSKQYPRARRLVIGHSVGGFLTGFAENGHLIDRMLLVSAHTGYWRDYAYGARAGMYCLWHGVMPILTRMVGYFPGRRLHLLEDLPAGVAYQWAARRKPDFWWNLRLPDGSADTVLIESLIARFHAIRARTLALQFSDDPFATEAATDRILGLFANCEATRLRIGPADVGGQKIGHFGFFRSRFRTTLWRRVAESLVEHT
jgi:predicted alpha/beta hydrolase